MYVCSYECDFWMWNEQYNMLKLIYIFDSSCIKLPRYININKIDISIRKRGKTKYIIRNVINNIWDQTVCVKQLCCMLHQFGQIGWNSVVTEIYYWWPNNYYFWWYRVVIRWFHRKWSWWLQEWNRLIFQLLKDRDGMLLGSWINWFPERCSMVIYGRLDRMRLLMSDIRMTSSRH